MNAIPILGGESKHAKEGNGIKKWERKVRKKIDLFSLLSTRLGWGIFAAV